MLYEAGGVSKFFVVCGYTDLRKGIDGLAQLLVDLLRKPLLHYLIAEYILAKNLRNVEIFAHFIPYFPSLKLFMPDTADQHAHHKKKEAGCQ